MVNSSVIQLLRSLSKEELIGLEDFVNSPFFNKKNHIVKLFNYLKNFHPHYKYPEKLERKEIYKFLYPDKPYNYGIMKNIIYDLNLICEKYLELMSYRENKPEQYRNLLAELTRRNLDKSFKKNLKKAYLLLEQGIKDDTYFRNKMDIELLKFNFHVSNISRTGKPESGLQGSDYLLSYFLTKFFKINYNNLVTRDNFGIFEEIVFLDEVLNYIQKTPEIDPVILLYYNRFMVIYKENEAYYHEYKRLVKEQFENLGRKEKFNSYNNFLNYCYGKIASGDWNYYKELFEIYNEMIAGNIITDRDNNYIDAVHFRLAAETGAKLKKFGWVKRFIEQYSGKLPPKLKTNEINIAFANYNLLKKDYNEAQKCLSQTQVYTVYDKVYIYILQSMIYYETKQFENLISEVDAIKHFIMNDKSLWVESRKSFKKYADYLNELVKLNTRNRGETISNINKIKQNLISENSIFEKKWLLEKLVSIEKNH